MGGQSGTVASPVLRQLKLHRAKRIVAVLHGADSSKNCINLLPAAS
jgi:hypothetical protein